jgi:ERCC4-type nuclease
MLVIKDTKEKDGFNFKDYTDVKISNDSLKYGDYTLAICDHPDFDESVIIERKKNCRELINNLGSEFERFCREMDGLQKYKHKQIIVCGPNNFSYLVDRGLTKLSLNFIYKQLAYLQVNYNVDILFFPNIEEAENYVYRLFKEIERKLDE